MSWKVGSVLVVVVIALVPALRYAPMTHFTDGWSSDATQDAVSRGAERVNVSRGSIPARTTVLPTPPATASSVGVVTSTDAVVNGTKMLAVIIDQTIEANARIAVKGDSREVLRLEAGVNDPVACKGVEPNRTFVSKFRCPVPGLNNVLYTQHNRWFCAYRDNVVLRLRDRICNKGSQEPYRYTTILQIDHARIPKHRKGRICWSDIQKQDEARGCTWKDIPKFYGSDLWWEARRLIDFHPQYYREADDFIAKHLGGKPFIGVHLRRGDYQHHCIKLKRTNEKPLVPFRGAKTLRQGFETCFPTTQQIVESLVKLSEESGLKNVFVATNRPDEFENVTAVNIITMPPSVLRYRMRVLDTVIMEMVILSKASQFVFNRYSSFSGTVYEMAVIHDRLKIKDDPRMRCW